MIYVLQAEDRDLFKVGHSAGNYAAGVRQRRGELQIGCPDVLRIRAMWPGDKAGERETHEALAEFSVRGEWFRGNAILDALIAEWPVRDEPTEGAGRRTVCMMSLPYELVLRLDRVRGDVAFSDFVEAALTPYVEGVGSLDRCVRGDVTSLRLIA